MIVIIVRQPTECWIKFWYA